MTYREKLKQEHPELVGPQFVAGCCGCPPDYGYPSPVGRCAEMNCEDCWNREVTERTKYKLIREMSLKEMAAFLAKQLVEVVLDPGADVGPTVIEHWTVKWESVLRQEVKQ